MQNRHIILDPHWRQMDEVFSPDVAARLWHDFDVVWGQDGPIPDEIYDAALPDAVVLISASPVVDAGTLDRAPNLRAVIEVSGAFPDTIDYDACAARGVEVLTCAPGFRSAVAEMGLAMALSGARGLITEHEAFRAGREHWLNDNPESDFSLFGARVGFIGFGQIAQEITRLLAPFAPQIRAVDPWLPPQIAQDHGVELAKLNDLLGWARCLFVTAIPTADNFQLLNRDRITMLADNSLVVLLSRAHLVDFEALVAAAGTGRIRVATDVYPSEPLAAVHPCRQYPNLILSPHRAAAVAGGRHQIGDMILHDLTALFAGQDIRQLGRANAATIKALAGIGDAAQVAAMAEGR